MIEETSSVGISIKQVNKQDSKTDHAKKKKIPCWLTRAMAEDFTRQEVLFTTLREALLYIVFVVAVLLSTSAKRNSSMFYLTQALKAQFLEKDFTTANSLGIKFKGITSITDFWEYSTTLLMDSFYWEHYYNTFENANEQKSKEDDHKILFENKLIGVPRMRQVQIKNGSCEVKEYMRPFAIYNCYGGYRPERLFKGSFGKKTGTAWVYQDKSKTKSIDWPGTSRYSFDGGGFYQDLSPNKNKSIEIIEDLRNNLWITRATRVIFIDFSIYNANLNLFCICKLIFEFPSTGGVKANHYFLVGHLDMGPNSQNQVSWVAEIVVYVLGVFYLCEELREITYFKLKYFFQFWAYMDLVIIGLVLANLFTSIIFFPDVSKALKEIAANQDKYGNLESIGEMKDINNNICAMLLFFTFIKIFKYLNFNKTMGQLNNTLKRCAIDIFCFAIMFFIIFCGFAELGCMLFGNTVGDFFSFGVAMFTLLRTILGDFDYAAINHANSLLAPIYFISYIFLVFFVLLNMFLAIINDTYADIKTEISVEPDEMQLTEFMKKKVFKILRKCGLKISDKTDSTDINATNQQIRDALNKCGFSALEIEMFFARFNIDPLAEVVNFDTAKIMKDLEAQLNVTAKVDESSYVQLGDFIAQQENLERIERNIMILSQRFETMLSKMEALESIRKNKGAKG